MEIAVVILNWNGVRLLESFLPSVTAYSKEATIYVADNASTDTSVSFIKENYPSIKIVSNAVNGGYAKGYNDALQHIKADVYCLLNSDVAVTENWLQPIIKLFNEHQDIAAVQPKILDYYNPEKFEYAGAAGGFIDFFGYPYCRGRLFNFLATDTGQYNDTIPIFWASGACLFIRSETFHLLNGFDEDFFAHQEEIDLCWRIQNLGKQIIYSGNTTVYHVGGATLNNLSPKKTFLNFRNSLFSILKNAPGTYVFFIIFSRLLLDGIAGLKFLLELKPKHTLAILKAHLSFYLLFIKIYKKRSATQVKNYYNKKSIVWNYFILGKKS